MSTSQSFSSIDYQEILLEKLLASLSKNLKPSDECILCKRLVSHDDNVCDDKDVHLMVLQLHKFYSYCKIPLQQK